MIYLDMDGVFVAFHMEDCGEYGIAILLLHREIVADSVLHCDSTTAANDASLIEQGLGECGLARTVIAKQCDVFDFV